MNKVSCIIMDWAGTAVDFGCFAPLNVFLSVFREKGLDITYRQAREPMGLLKVDHIRAILEMEPVREQVERKYGRSWNESDVRELYAGFETHLFASLRISPHPFPAWWKR